MGFLKFFKEEAAVIRERDPAIKSNKEVLLYPCFWALWKYRKAHKYYLKGRYYKARKISQKAARKPFRLFHNVTHHFPLCAPLVIQTL